MKKFTSKHFTSRQEANDFAVKVRGVIEGPFYDFDANVDYIVFYRETVNGLADGKKLFWCVTSTYDDQGRVTAAITATMEATSKPEKTFTSTRRKDIYNDWFDSREEAEKFVEEAKMA